MADVVLDPFPFGGGVTTLEAFSVCSPVVTAPNLQTVPRLAAGMYRHMRCPHVAGAGANMPATAPSSPSTLPPKKNGRLNPHLPIMWPAADASSPHSTTHGGMEKACAPVYYDGAAATAAEYAAAAVRLLRNDTERQQLRKAICRARKVLYEDQTTVDEWAAFLLAVAASPFPSSTTASFSSSSSSSSSFSPPPPQL